MRFTNLTRANEIGANSYYIETAGRRLVLDCGMHPTREGEDALPDLRLVPDGEVDAILVSHAHLDHFGSLPVLMRRQPQSRVFMTAPTARLGEMLLQGKSNLQAPWLGLTGFFAIALMLSLLIFIGEAVRDAFDPRKTFR